MLLRKMFRDIKKNFGQFLSILILAFLALSMFCTFEGNVIAHNKARDTFHKECNLSNIWVYGESFTQDNIDKLENLNFIDKAQLRTCVVGSAPDFDSSQVDIILQNDNIINKPFYMSGEEYDPTNSDCIWIADSFAKARNLKLGDNFTVYYNGITFTKKIAGFVESCEYEYRKADSDAETVYKNIAFIYMSYNAFPTREYINHLIEKEKITADFIIENTHILDDMLVELNKKGLDKSYITQDVLLSFVKNMSDSQLANLMPYTQILLTTTDGLALEHEKEIQDALDKNYSAIIDEHSVFGIERLNSELQQHHSFSYLFAIIFLVIAILVIATTMNRIIEKQRTQIGTMNALGMKHYKIVFHYIGYSFFVSLLGVILGIWVGNCYLTPIWVDMFADEFIVPNLHAQIDTSYIIIGLLVVAICVLSSYLSCKKVLNTHPAEALRPAVAKQGISCIWEKLPFWSKLSFNVQYNLKSISRAKLRTFMCILGTTVGMLLMIYGVAINSIMGDMVSLNFDKSQPANYQVALSSDSKISDIDKLCDETNGQLVMLSQVEIAKSVDALSSEKKKQTLTVLENKDLYFLLDSNQNPIKLTNGLVGLSRKLSADMNLSVGDTFYWHIYSQNEWHSAVVGYIYQSAEVQGIAYLRDDFEKTNSTFTPTYLYTDSDLTNYKNDSCVVSVNDKETLKQLYLDVMSTVNVMIYMMIAFSVILIIVVLYNSGDLTFNERVREFATLKVMGFQTSQIRKILATQNFWLSVIGILIGSPFGRIALNYMMNSNGDNYDYNLDIKLSVYLISALIVLVLSILISYMFQKRIKNLDLVEVLKGME